MSHKPNDSEDIGVISVLWMFLSEDIESEQNTQKKHHEQDVQKTEIR